MTGTQTTLSQPPGIRFNPTRSRRHLCLVFTPSRKAQTHVDLRHHEVDDDVADESWVLTLSFSANRSDSDAAPVYAEL